MILRHESHYSLGCDISDHSIKIVQLLKQRKKQKLISYLHKKLPTDTIREGEIKKVNEFKNFLKKQLFSLNGKKLQTKKISVNVPEAKSFMKKLTIKTDSHDNSLPLIKKELQKHLPMNLDDAYFDYECIGESGDTTDILVAAVPKSISDLYHKIFSECGMEMYAFELESVALTRILTADDLTIPLLILDLGHVRSTLTIIDQNAIQLAVSIPLTGEHINNTITEKLKISHEQAEKAKRECGLVKDRCKGALRIVLDAATDDLAMKIKDAIAFYQSHNAKASTFNTIVITGGGANFKNIENVLKEKTGMHVIKGMDRINLNTAPVKNLLDKNNTTLHYIALAAGLAQRKNDI